MFNAVKQHPDELYIFVTSERPDPYVNVLALLLPDSHISAVHLVAIKEHEYAGEQLEGRLGSITSRIHDRLEDLSRLCAQENPYWSARYTATLNKLDSISTRNDVINGRTSTTG